MSKKEKYIFDSNCFIDPWNNYYRHNSFASYWDDFIFKLIKGGEILVVDEVYREITKKEGDELGKWMKNKKIKELESYIKTDSDITRIVTDITHDYPTLVDNIKGRSIADPYIIAAADLCNKNHPDKNFIVVTFEKIESTTKKTKIPNVCKSRGIDCVDLFEFIERKQPSFVLK